MSLKKTEKRPPIEFELDKTSPLVARLLLYPILDVHSDEDVKEKRDSVIRGAGVKKYTMQVRWIPKSHPLIPSEKIPDSLMIKALQEELGKKEAYIEELKYRLAAKSARQSKREKKEAKSTSLKKENKNLRQTISELVTKLNTK